MELTFLGTRGEIKIRSRRHLRHSALLVRLGQARVMIDCGADWLDHQRRVDPTAIVVTHAHADHAAGLAKGAACPVHATEDTWSRLRHYPVHHRITICHREPFSIDSVSFEAFAVEHSLLAPAVGYR